MIIVIVCNFQNYTTGDLTCREILYIPTITSDAEIIDHLFSPYYTELSQLRSTEIKTEMPVPPISHVFAFFVFPHTFFFPFVYLLLSFHWSNEASLFCVLC